MREAAARAAGQPYLLATAEVEAGQDLLTPGLLVRATVEVGTQTPLDHARQFVGDLLRW